MYSRILVPLDGSALAERALAQARDLARSSEATIHLLQVVSRYPELEATHGSGVESPQILEYSVEQAERLITQRTTRAQEYLQQVATELKNEGFSVATALQEGAASEKILEYAEEQDIDLIVMSTHGYGGLRRLLLGSVTDKVVRASEVPVLVVPPGAGPE